MFSLYLISNLQDNPVYLASFLSWRIDSFRQTSVDHIQTASALLMIIVHWSTSLSFFCLLSSRNSLFLLRIAHSPSRIQNSCRPYVSTDVRTSQEASPQASACVSVCDAPRVARYFVVLEKQGEGRLPSLPPRVEMGGQRDYARLLRVLGCCETFRLRKAEEMKVARPSLRWH